MPNSLLYVSEFIELPRLSKIKDPWKVAAGQ